MFSEEIWTQAAQMLRSGQALVLVRILYAEGSTPRGEGAAMLVGKDGWIAGTVGGGAVEFLALRDAGICLQEQKNTQKVYSLDTRRDQAAEKDGTTEGPVSSGMICGGEVTLGYTLLSGRDGEEVLQEAEKQQAAAKPRVYLFGGGHVSLCAAEELMRIGFETVIWDDREEFADSARFPGAAEVICAPYTDIAARLRITAEDYLLIMTRGHAFDYEVQKYALTTPAGYIGLIGSHAKIAAAAAKLLEDGFTKEQTERFYAPVGIQIGAETAEEIAVSIAAELILVRAHREGRRKVREGKVIPYRIR